MTGWYKVSTTPEYCGTQKTDSIYITVYSPLKPTDATSNQSVETCVHQRVTFAASVTGGASDYIYQWQSSADSGITWTNISGATSAFYMPPTQTGSGTMYYRRVTTDTCGTVYNYVTLKALPCYIPVNPNIQTKVDKK